jgi:DNA repair photolyase
VEPAKSDQFPWTHVADPYRGCQLRCEFCNSRSLSEWVGETQETFMRRVSVVQNVADVLPRELAAEAMSPRMERVICVGATSDPYQPAEERFEATREILKACLEAEHPVVVQTRQALILRDLDVLEALAERGLVNVLMGMQTAIEGVRSKIELGTATVAERYRAMRMLATKHVPVGLLLSPIMPELTDDEAVLDETIRRAGDAGAKWVVSQVLDLRGSAGVKVRLFVENFIAELGPKYDKLYPADAKGRIDDEAYVQRITELVAKLAAQYAMDDVSHMLTSGRDARALLVRR